MSLNVPVTAVCTDQHLQRSAHGMLSDLGMGSDPCRAAPVLGNTFPAPEGSVGALLWRTGTAGTACWCGTAGAGLQKHGHRPEV